MVPTDDLYPKIYHSCFFIVTYLAPLGLMAMAYFQIFRKLWGRQVRPTLVSLFGAWEGMGYWSKRVDSSLHSEHAMPSCLQPERGNTQGHMKLKAKSATADPGTK